MIKITLVTRAIRKIEVVTSILKTISFRKKVHYMQSSPTVQNRTVSLNSRKHNQELPTLNKSTRKLPGVSPQQLNSSLLPPYHTFSGTVTAGAGWFGVPFKRQTSSGVDSAKGWTLASPTLSTALAFEPEDSGNDKWRLEILRFGRIYSPEEIIWNYVYSCTEEFNSFVGW